MVPGQDFRNIRFANIFFLIVKNAVFQMSYSGKMVEILMKMKLRINCRVRILQKNVFRSFLKAVEKDGNFISRGHRKIELWEKLPKNLQKILGGDRFRS